MDAFQSKAWTAAVPGIPRPGQPRAGPSPGTPRSAEPSSLSRPRAAACCPDSVMQPPEWPAHTCRASMCMRSFFACACACACVCARVRVCMCVRVCVCVPVPVRSCVLQRWNDRSKGASAGADMPAARQQGSQCSDAGPAAPCLTLMDSALASSTKAQVLMTMASASS